MGFRVVLNVYVGENQAGTGRVWVGVSVPPFGLAINTRATVGIFTVTPLALLTKVDLFRC